jgi:anti-sigma factor RsiW
MRMLIKNEQFEEWLPWYVNGTLGASNRAAMDAYIAKHPNAQHEVRFYQRMGETMQRRIAKVPNDIGLATTLARIQQQERPKSAVTPASSPPRESFFSKLFGGSLLKPALALSCAVILGQSVLLMQQKQDATIYRGATPATATKTDGAYLRVVFKASATEGEIRVLLATMQAWIAGGPGLQGEYFLRFTPDKVQAAEDALRNSGLTTEIAPAATAPAAPQ